MGMDSIDPRNQGIPVNEGVLTLTESINPSHPFDVETEKVTITTTFLSLFYSFSDLIVLNGILHRNPKFIMGFTN